MWLLLLQPQRFDHLECSTKTVSKQEDGRKINWPHVVVSTKSIFKRFLWLGIGVPPEVLIISSLKPAHWLSSWFLLHYERKVTNMTEDDPRNTDAGDWMLKHRATTWHSMTLAGHIVLERNQRSTEQILVSAKDVHLLCLACTDQDFVHVHVVLAIAGFAWLAHQEGFQLARLLAVRLHRPAPAVRPAWMCTRKGGASAGDASHCSGDAHFDSGCWDNEALYIIIPYLLILKPIQKPFQNSYYTIITD